jgi:hypothetical protein
MRSRILFVVAALACFGAAGSARQERRDWPVYLGDPGGTKYSPLAQITDERAPDGRVSWTSAKRLPEFGDAYELRGHAIMTTTRVLSTMAPRRGVDATTAPSQAYDLKVRGGPGSEGVQFGTRVASWTDGKARRIYINARRGSSR